MDGRNRLTAKKSNYVIFSRLEKVRERNLLDTVEWIEVG